MWDDFRCLCIRLVCYCIAAKFGLKQGLNFRMAESPSSAKRTLVWVWTPVIQMWPLYQRLTNWHGYVWYIQSEQWCHCWMLTVMILKKHLPAYPQFASSTVQYTITCNANTHTHTRLTALFLGLPRWAGTRKVKPIWILLKQETVSGSGISWAICKSAHNSDK